MRLLSRFLSIFRAIKIFLTRAFKLQKTETSEPIPSAQRNEGSEPIYQDSPQMQHSHKTGKTKSQEEEEPDPQCCILMPHKAIQDPMLRDVFVATYISPIMYNIAVNLELDDILGAQKNLNALRDANTESVRIQSFKTLCSALSRIRFRISLLNTMLYYAKEYKPFITNYQTDYSKAKATFHTLPSSGTSTSLALQMLEDSELAANLNKERALIVQLQGDLSNAWRDHKTIHVHGTLQNLEAADLDDIHAIPQSKPSQFAYELSAKEQTRLSECKAQFAEDLACFSKTLEEHNQQDVIVIQDTLSEKQSGNAMFEAMQKKFDELSQEASTASKDLIKFHLELNKTLEQHATLLKAKTLSGHDAFNVKSWNDIVKAPNYGPLSLSEENILEMVQSSKDSQLNDMQIQPLQMQWAIATRVAKAKQTLAQKSKKLELHNTLTLLQYALNTTQSSGQEQKKHNAEALIQKLDACFNEEIVEKRDQQYPDQCLHCIYEVKQIIKKMADMPCEAQGIPYYIDNVHNKIALFLAVNVMMEDIFSPLKGPYQYCALTTELLGSQYTFMSQQEMQKFSSENTFQKQLFYMLNTYKTIGGQHESSLTIDIVRNWLIKNQFIQAHQAENLSFEDCENIVINKTTTSLKQHPCMAFIAAIEQLQTVTQDLIAEEKATSQPQWPAFHELSSHATQIGVQMARINLRNCQATKTKMLGESTATTDANTTKEVENNHNKPQEPDASNTINKSSIANSLNTGAANAKQH